MNRSDENTHETVVTILSKVHDLRRTHLPWGELSDIRLSGAETGGAFGVPIIKRRPDLLSRGMFIIGRTRSFASCVVAPSSGRLNSAAQSRPATSSNFRRVSSMLGVMLGMSRSASSLMWCLRVLRRFLLQPKRRTLRKMISQDVLASRFNSASRSRDPA